MRSKIWLEKLVWEIDFAGRNNYIEADKHGSLRESLEELNKDSKYWFESSVSGIGLSQMQQDKVRLKNVRVFGTIQFHQDNELQADVAATRRFGDYLQDYNHLILSAPLSNRQWILDVLRAHPKPIITCSLRQLAKVPDIHEVESFAIVSDRRRLIRNEAT